MAVTWTHLSPAHSPDPMYGGFGWAFKKDTSEGILYGRNSITGLPETWGWDGTDWHQKTTSTSPADAYTAGTFKMAWDEIGQQIICSFFEIVSSVLTHHTFAYTTDWAELTVANPFPPSGPHGFDPYCEMYLHGMCEAPGIGNIIAFGGEGTDGNGGTVTRLWDSTDWTTPSPATTPNKGFLPWMMYDSIDNSVIMYGRRHSGTSERFETDKWDGTDWSVLTTTIASTEAGNGSSFAYHEAAQVGLRFGGEPSNHNDRTWLWPTADQDWSYEVPSPTPPQNFGNDSQLLIYNDQTEKVYLFGGVVSSAYVNDTWSADISPHIEMPPPPLGPGKLAYYHNGAWHIVADL